MFPVALGLMTSIRTEIVPDLYPEGRCRPQARKAILSSATGHPIVVGGRMAFARLFITLHHPHFLVM